MKIPSSEEHLEMLAAMTALSEGEAASKQQEVQTELRMIGTSLSVLYQAATCHRQCHRGPHILEALCGRMYNLGAAAYILATSGFYDEALNLIRSIGEAGNLLSLSVVDKNALREWLSSDKKTRLKKFSPAEVRRALKKQEESAVLLADDDWYSRFCETYTHITPQTKPNVHNDANQPYVGGVFQANGYSSTLGELATVLVAVSLYISKYFDFDDLFEELTEIIRDSDKDAENIQS
jgi:hypothetical protein